MSWTYDNPTASEKDEVRFIVGDTDTTDQLLTDEEINYLLNKYDSVNEAAYQAALSIAAKFARLVNISTSKTNISYAQQYEHYKDLAAELYSALQITPIPYSRSTEVDLPPSLDRDFEDDVY